MSDKKFDTKVRADMTLPKVLQEHIVTRIEDHLKFDQFTEVHMAWDIGNYAYNLGRQELESQVRVLTGERDKQQAAIREFLAHDGGEGSLDYDASKHYANRRLLRQLAGMRGANVPKT